MTYLHSASLQTYEGVVGWTVGWQNVQQCGGLEEQPSGSQVRRAESQNLRMKLSELLQCTHFQSDLISILAFADCCKSKPSWSNSLFPLVLHNNYSYIFCNKTMKRYNKHNLIIVKVHQVVSKDHEFSCWFVLIIDHNVPALQTQEAAITIRTELLWETRKNRLRV